VLALFHSDSFRDSEISASLLREVFFFTVAGQLTALSEQTGHQVMLRQYGGDRHGPHASKYCTNRFGFDDS